MESVEEETERLSAWEKYLEGDDDDKCASQGEKCPEGKDDKSAPKEDTIKKDNEDVKGEHKERATQWWVHQFPFEVKRTVSN